MKATAKEHVASYDVLVNGEEISQEHKDRVLEIRVVDYLRLPSVCTLEIAYPRAEGIDAHPFDVGTPFEVRLGATEAMAPTTLFKGQVVTLEPEFGAGGCKLTVSVYDPAQLLTRSRHVRTFQDQTATDIVKGIVADAGLTPECDESPVIHEFVQQGNETDWDFIWRLAERIGFEFVVEGTVAMFRKPSSARAIDLEWPETLSSFRPRVTAVQQVQNVTLLAHDPKTKQVIEASAQQPAQVTEIGLPRSAVAGAFEPATLHVATEPVETGAEGAALTQALQDKLANAYIAAEGVAAGNPRLKAGTNVNVAGVGSRFSGTYRVAMTVHVLRGGGGYTTHFANAPTDTILGAMGAHGRAAPDFGAQLVLGVVTNTDDKLGLGRVRVRYPALGANAEGAWARIATPSAGKDRGLLMLPVVGEEVLIGFEHGDTRRPYVLGSLFNGVDKPGDMLLQKRDGSFAVRSGKGIYSEAAGDYAIKSGGKLTANGREVTVEATTVLELKCGSSSIKLAPSGVTVSGTTINLG